MTPNKPRCFFVIGPEASACRLTTSLLIDGGCFGESSHDQRLDRVIRDDNPPTRDIIEQMEGRHIVYRQSMPHGGGDRYPNLFLYEERINRHLNREVFWIVTCRDWWPNLQSKVKARYRRDFAHALQEITTEYIKIFEHLIHRKGRFYMFQTSLLMREPYDQIRVLGEIIGVPIPIESAERIRNEDFKYWPRQKEAASNG